jgi:serine/threonine-protein kinase
VVAKALAKIPEERFATARQFSEALRRAAEGQPASDIEPTLVVVRDAAPVQAARPEALPTGEMELEFWRSIKDSDDANDFELYIRQFPQGVYASLAGRKIARLRGGAAGDDSDTRTMAESDRTRLDRGAQRDAPKPEPGAPRPAAGETAGKPRRAVALALGGAIAVTAAATSYFFAKPGAVQPPAADAGEQARRDADKTRAEAELRVKRGEEIRARREAGARAEREVKLRARLEAEAKARRETEEKAQREAAAKAKLAAESEAVRQKEAEKKKPMTLRPSF